MPPASPAPEPTHFLGCQREAARCPVSLDGGQLNSRFPRATPRVGPRRAPAKPAAEEIVHHIRQCGAGGSSITEGHTGDIFVAAKSRKMAKHIAGVCIAEHEPWISLVGYAALNLDMPP